MTAAATLQTVTGSVALETVRLADGHAHVWIEPPAGVAPEFRIELHDASAIRAELSDLRAAGVTTLIDCQPGGCGRDATMLHGLALTTSLQIAAVTGFHLRKYYPPANWLWSASVEAAAAYFVEELTVGMRETNGAIPATCIKVAYDGAAIDGQQRVLMEAAAQAARQTGAAILCHTEAGKNVEALLPYFAAHGVAANRLYYCHVDKRPDAGLHRELAQAGVLLGYDTFARPKYHPEANVWPLLRTLVAAGLDGAIALGLDLAFPWMWRHGGGSGPQFLTETLLPRLRAEGFSPASIARLTGANVAQRLTRDAAPG